MKTEKMIIAVILLLGCLNAFGTESVILYKNQKKSLLDWKDAADYSKFLSFKLWKEDQDLKDASEEWESIIRHRKNKEFVGKILECVSKCIVDKGDGIIRGTSLSTIFEGDEVRTSKASYAWIFLVDGTMVRLSPESSVAFSEINLSENEVFYYARINYGNVSWHSRLEYLYEERNDRETDVIFFPLTEYRAMPNRAKFQSEEDNLFNIFSTPLVEVQQYQKLNQLIKENNLKWKAKTSHAFIVMPNGTVYGKNITADFISLLGGKSYVYQRSFKEQGYLTDAADTRDIEFYFRGYENIEPAHLEIDQWMEVDEKGRSLARASGLPLLGISQLPTRRFPSINIARELWMQEYSLVMYDADRSAANYAKNYGYKLWEDLSSKDPNRKSELLQRIEFLREYTRRSETANLNNVDKLAAELKRRGESLDQMALDTHFFIHALNRYNTFEIETLPTDNESEELNSKKHDLWKRVHAKK